MKRKTDKLLIILACLFIFIGCNKADYQAPVPTYLYIKPFALQVRPDNSQGANSASILDAWVFQDGKFLGSYGIPSLIPIQKTGKSIFVFNAGIRNSGQDDQRLMYPMYASYTDTLALIPKAIDSISPIVNYVDNSKFALLEDFDGNGSSFEVYSQQEGSIYYKQGDTVIKVNDSNNNTWKANNLVGLFTPTDSTYVMDYQSKVVSDLPLSTPVYLEFDYKSDFPFTVGYWVNDPSGNVKQVPDIYIGADGIKPGWNKMYLDLSLNISTSPAGSSYRIFFRLDKGDNVAAKPHLYIDNIKLIFLQ